MLPSQRESPESFRRIRTAVNSLGVDAREAFGVIYHRVLLTGESEVLGTPNGAECFRTSFRLLSKTCAKLSVFLPVEPPELRREAEQLESVLSHSGNRISVLRSQPRYRGFNAVLNIGTEVRPDLPWTAINSEGWLARVSSGNEKIDSNCSRSNPIGAMGAAALGVAEVFKRLVAVKSERGPLANGLSYSMFSYSIESADSGPPIPSPLVVGNLALIGAGSIGCAVAYLLSRLDIKGRAFVVDPQDFETANIGTCVSIGQAQVGKGKAEHAAEMLGSPLLEAIPYKESVEDFGRRAVNQTYRPNLIVNGLDNIQARHRSQDLWPDAVIDGAVEDFMCQVSFHPWRENVACLRCMFREQESWATSAEEVQSGATGIIRSRLAEPESVLTVEDVVAAPPEKRGFLRSRVGRPVCSVVQEAMLASLTEHNREKIGSVAVSFVASFAATMVVAEAVKVVAGLPTQLAPRFQADLLRGPSGGIMFPQERRGDCICVARKESITRFRRQFERKTTKSSSEQNPQEPKGFSAL